MSLPQIRNTQARRLFLQCHALGRRRAAPPSPSPSPAAKLSAMIDRLGFVQIDSINTVSRAHHMILRSRLGSYREPHLKRLYERDRGLFEHWTHDASFIPMRFFPHWKVKFQRDKDRLSGRWERWQQHDFNQKLDTVLEQVAAQGPVSSGDVGKDEARVAGGWWNWHPSKTALEFLWRTGALSVSGRDGFKKVYDLTENVIPADLLSQRYDLEETIDFACRAALERLGFATSGELAAFFDLITPAEARHWMDQALARGMIERVEIEGTTGERRQSVALPATLADMDALPPIPRRMKILSPFDPVLRDRKRAHRLFGFDYRIEVFVPAEKRRYGYYVFPVLYGDRLVGRIDMKANRQDGSLQVSGYWPEPDHPMNARMQSTLEKELDRICNQCELERTCFSDGWLRGEG